ncbi:phosphotransferase enzyme family protein [Acinetobacter sp. MD2]|uniref:phosphotransferase enzyme family protein n=1 Tax=Acinetobacter sp. MD2 TaxID=2600066 RepID=UPI002D1F85AA|nr:phosphotransferase [Acinetobacter sp. MD2]MEB3766424.1 phosphotransferase [Acinetobacter sp. MD2]
MLEKDVSLGHGMTTELEPKDWQNLSLIDIQALQQDYPILKGEITLLWHSPRPFSSAALIQVNGQARFFIKRSHGSFRSVQDLMEEHQFIAHLAQKGLHVPIVISAQNGCSAIAVSAWSYEVHQYTAAQDIYADTLSWKPFFCPEHAYKTGIILAKMHQAAQDYPVRTGRSTSYLYSNQNLLESEDIITALMDKIRQSPALCHYFSNKVLEPLFLQQLQYTHQNIAIQLRHFPKIWTHNDLHASNLLWCSDTADSEIAQVIDFGLCDYTCAAYDLAVTVERNFIDWLELSKTNDLSIDMAGLTQFIHAYVTQNDQIDQLLILPELLPIIHVDFALSELEYFVAITQNMHHADAAYYDWLIAHTAWFFCPQGQIFKTQLMAIIHETVKRIKL